MYLLQNIAVVGAQGNVFTDGLAVLVVGIGVVFVALIGLVVILELMGKFFDYKGKQDNAKAQKEVIAAPLVVAEPVADQTSQVDDLELIAVITATIAASMGTSAEGLQVRSIRKTNNAWGMSGRTKQLYHLKTNKHA